MEDDYYAILEVSSDATNEEISRSYKRLALRLHPDKNYSSDTLAAFQQVQSAYDKLKDVHTRQIYDQSRSFRRRQDAALEAERQRRERRTTGAARQDVLRREAFRKREQRRQQAVGGHATLQAPRTVEELRAMHRREKAAREAVRLEAARQAEQPLQISQEDAVSQSATREGPIFHRPDVQQLARVEAVVREPTRRQVIRGQQYQGQAIQGQGPRPQGQATQEETANEVTRQNIPHQDAADQRQSAQRQDTPVPQRQARSSNEQRDQPEQQATVIPDNFSSASPPQPTTSMSNPPHYSSHSFALPTLRHRRPGSDPPNYNTHSFYQPRLDSRAIAQPITALEASIHALEEAQRVQEDAAQTPDERLERIRQWKAQKSQHYFDRRRKYTTKKGVIDTQLADLKKVVDSKNAELKKIDKQIEEFEAQKRKEAHALDIRKYTNRFQRKLYNIIEYEAMHGDRQGLKGSRGEQMQQIYACEHELEKERSAYETEEHNARAVTVREVRTYLTQPGTEQDSRPWACRLIWRTLGEVQMPANFFLPQTGLEKCVGVSHDMKNIHERKFLSVIRPVMCQRCNKSIRSRENYSIKSSKCSKCDLLVCGLCAKWMLVLKEYEEYLEGRDVASLFNFELF